MTCGRDYSRSSVFSHVPQKERIVAATRIVLGRVWFKLFYRRSELHCLYITSCIWSGSQVPEWNAFHHLPCSWKICRSLWRQEPLGHTQCCSWWIKDVTNMTLSPPPFSARNWDYKAEPAPSTSFCDLGPSRSTHFPSSAARPRYSMQDTWISGEEGKDWFWFFFMFHHAALQHKLQSTGVLQEKSADPGRRKGERVRAERLSTTTTTPTTPAATAALATATATATTATTATHGCTNPAPIMEHAFGLCPAFPLLGYSSMTLPTSQLCQPWAQPKRIW